MSEFYPGTKEGTNPVVSSLCHFGLFREATVLLPGTEEHQPGSITLMHRRGSQK